MFFRIRTEDFNLQATLDSGQVFNFMREADGTYSGSIRGVSLRLNQDGRFLGVETASGVSELMIRNYFDLDRDLSTVYRILEEDPRLNLVGERFKGLRIIRQDPWEALACFMISSNNNIKRIQKIRSNLSSFFSKSSACFPEPFFIAESTENCLRKLGLGYRAPFLLWAARYVTDHPTFFGDVRKLTYEAAKRHLLQFPGIGDKVADCALLFGFQQYAAFPVDIWIYRTVRKLYFRNRRVSEPLIRSFGQTRWGKEAGYIQQYLYHGAKSGLL